MHDPRTPEIMAWVDAMPFAGRLTVMHAMSFGLYQSISALIRPFQTCMGILPMLNDFGPLRQSSFSPPPAQGTRQTVGAIWQDGGIATAVR
jgi:hypothetical protein